MKRKKKESRLDRILGIPQEVTLKLPRISCLNFKKLVIENYKAILDYQEIYVRINLSTGILGISGQNLNLTQMTEDDLEIIGEIEKIEFEKTVEEEQC